MGDAEQYRPQGEVEKLKTSDPIPRYRQQLISDGIGAAELDALEKIAARDVSDAFAFARSAELPTVEEAFHHVFAIGAV
jgi:pyruvate dehydrogenase E1 component alpha subunit